MKQSIILKTILILGTIIVVIFITAGYFFLQSDKELIGQIRSYNLESAMKSLDNRQEARLGLNKKEMQGKLTMLAKNSSLFLLNYDIDGLKINLAFDMKPQDIKAIQIWDSSVDELFLLSFKKTERLFLVMYCQKNLKNM